jgi:hypothetical protein
VNWILISTLLICSPPENGSPSITWMAWSDNTSLDSEILLPSLTLSYCEFPIV